MSRASNLAGFTTSISPPANLSVGIITASSVVVGGTNVITEINTKTSTGKAIAMAIVFG